MFLSNAFVNLRHILSNQSGFLQFVEWSHFMLCWFNVNMRRRLKQKNTTYLEMRLQVLQHIFQHFRGNTSIALLRNSSMQGIIHSVHAICTGGHALINCHCTRLPDSQVGYVLKYWKQFKLWIYLRIKLICCSLYSKYTIIWW